MPELYNAKRYKHLDAGVFGNTFLSGLASAAENSLLFAT